MGFKHVSDRLPSDQGIAPLVGEAHQSRTVEHGNDDRGEEHGVAVSRFLHHRPNQQEHQAKSDHGFQQRIKPQVDGRQGSVGRVGEDEVRFERRPEHANQREQHHVEQDRKERLDAG